MRFIIFSLAIYIVGCSSLPKCGNPDGAMVVLTGKNSCEVRIRQVSVGHDIKLPKDNQSRKPSEYNTVWRDSVLINGEIDMGHFVLVPLEKGPTDAK